jgi:hypothetical protein
VPSVIEKLNAPLSKPRKLPTFEYSIEKKSPFKNRSLLFVTKVGVGNFDPLWLDFPLGDLTFITPVSKTKRSDSPSSKFRESWAA